MFLRKRGTIADLPATGGVPLASYSLAPVRAKSLSVGSQRIGALAIGAVAFGALAIGAIAIGQLAIGRVRVRRLEIDELVIHKHRVTDALHETEKPGTEA